MFLAEKAHEALYKYHHGKEFFKTDVATAARAIESAGISFVKLYSKPDIGTRFTDIKSRGWIDDYPVHRDTLKQRIAILIDECPAEIFKNPNAGLVMYKNYTFAYTPDISKHQSTDVY